MTFRIPSIYLVQLGFDHWIALVSWEIGKQSGKGLFNTAKGFALSHLWILVLVPRGAFVKKPDRILTSFPIICPYVSKTLPIVSLTQWLAFLRSFSPRNKNYNWWIFFEGQSLNRRSSNCGVIHVELFCHVCKLDCILADICISGCIVFMGAKSIEFIHTSYGKRRNKNKLKKCLRLNVAWMATFTVEVGS